MEMPQTLPDNVKPMPVDVKTGDLSVPAYTLTFFFTILYILIDYGRPQEILPIGFLRPTLICIIGLIIGLVFEGGLWRSWSRQTKIILLINLLIMAYIPFARNTRAAFQTFLVMISYIPFILAVIASVNTMGRLKKLVNVLILIMLYQALYALAHKGVGAGSYFSDENDLSLYINMWLPFCYFLFSQTDSTKARILYGAGILAGLASIVVSFSRGGFVGLVAMSAAAWFFSTRKALTLGITCVFVLMAVLVGGNTYIKEMSTVTDTKESTAQQRILSWKAAWYMFLDNPLGVGGNNFQKNFHRYQPRELKKGMWNRVAHSLWFTLIPELGIFGIILYFLLLKYNIKDVLALKNIPDRDDGNVRYLHQLSRAYIVSLVGFFASATFLSVLYYAHYWYLSAMIVATAAIATRLRLLREETQVMQGSPVR